MNINRVDRDGHQYAEGLAGTQLIQTPGDTLEVIGFCLGYHIGRLLLYAENLPARFFDLRSGEAGELLQKFRTYHIKVATVVSAETIGQGTFAAMVAEENRGDQFRFFNDRSGAEAWLLQD